jgi:hypothetical protein
MTTDFNYIGLGIKPEDFTYVGHGIAFGIDTPSGEKDYEFEFNFADEFNTEAMVNRVESHVGAGLTKCNCCNHTIRNKAVFLNKSTDTLIVTGLDCAASISTLRVDVAGAKKQNLRQRKIAEKLNAISAVLVANPSLEDALTVSNKIIKSIAENFYKFGKLSEKQIAFVFKLAEERKAFEAVSQPVPAVGTKIEDEFQIIWLGASESRYGYNTTTEIKVGLKHKTGYTIFGKIASGSDNRCAVQDLAWRFDFFEKWIDNEGKIRIGLDKPTKPTSGFYYNGYDLSDMIRELKGTTHRFKFTVKSINSDDAFKGNAKGTIKNV